MDNFVGNKISGTAALFPDSPFDPKDYHAQERISNGVSNTCSHIEAKIDGKQKRKICQENSKQKFNLTGTDNTKQDVQDRKEDKQPRKDINTSSQSKDQQQNQKSGQQDFDHRNDSFHKQNLLQ